MFRVHKPIIKSIRCWVAAYGFCTEFLDGWRSWEPLLRSCLRCGWCRAPDDGLMYPKHVELRIHQQNYLVASSWHFKLFHEEDARPNNPQVSIYVWWNFFIKGSSRIKSNFAVLIGMWMSTLLPAGHTLFLWPVTVSSSETNLKPVYISAFYSESNSTKRSCFDDSALVNSSWAWRFSTLTRTYLTSLVTT